MDYGIAKALTGFTSSGDAKASRQQDFALMQNMYQQHQQQMNKEAALSQDMQAYKDKISELSSLNSGKSAVPILAILL